MKFSVVIPTYNGATTLPRTLASLADQQTSARWEVIVVINNSRDDTELAIHEVATALDGHLRVLSESEQGHCAALNAGIRAAEGDIILVTNHDARVPPDWLEEAGLALDRWACDYVGGKVLPLWPAERPAWLPDTPGIHRSVLALLDYGPDPIPFRERVPLGCNMAFRRDAFTRAGLWDNRFGRRPGTLIGQDVREWGLRARGAGLKGMYAPRMIVHHEVSSRRMTKRYFRRWMYWHGVSRAILYDVAQADIERPEQRTVDFSRVPHIAGVPRYLFRSIGLRSALGVVQASVRGNTLAAFEYEMRLWFFAGLVAQRWRDRHPSPGQAVSPGEP